MDDIYKSIEEYSPNKKQNTLFEFDDMIVDMLSRKKINPVITELFIIGRKWNTSPFLLLNLILMYQNMFN